MSKTTFFIGPRKNTSKQQYSYLVLKKVLVFNFY